MRSKLGLAASIAALVTYPIALAAGVAIGESAATAVVHFVLGSAFVLLAAAMFDFGLNRWVTWLGATAAALFGGTFLLQGVADLTGIAALHWLAFDVLGQQLERILPDVVYIWFAAAAPHRLHGRQPPRRLGDRAHAIRSGARHPHRRPDRNPRPLQRRDGLPPVRLAAHRISQASGVGNGCYVAPARRS